MAMPGWATLPNLIDLALALTALEAVAVVTWHRATGRGVAPGDFLANLASGACLMLALRGAVAGAGWLWIAPCLTAALAAHLHDLRRRWR